MPSIDSDGFVKARNPCDCKLLCGLAQGALDPDRQDANMCTLPMYQGRWSSGEQSIYAKRYLGREPLVKGMDRKGLPIIQEEPSEPADEGCPTGWAVSAFCDSFQPYKRLTGEHALPNPLVNSETPEHILEACRYWEHHRALALGRLADKREEMQKMRANGTNRH